MVYYIWKYSHRMFNSIRNLKSIKMHKETFLRKLMADNLVELRSIKECKAKGLLPKSVEQLFKNNHSCPMPNAIICRPTMANCFGKVLYVHQENTKIILEIGYTDRICLMTPTNDNYWWWPLEMVKR